MNLLGKIGGLLKKIRLNERTLALQDGFTLKARQQPAAGSAAATVLIECVEDPYHYMLFGTICEGLQSHQPLRVELYIQPAVRVGMVDSLRALLPGFFPLNRLMAARWIRLYSCFSDGVGYRGQSFDPLGDFVDLVRSVKQWRKLRSGEAVRDIVIEGVPVGDLLNDTYLRFRPAPRLDAADGFLLFILWNAHRSVRRAYRYFRGVRPQLYLTSYTTYIQHGIPARVALKQGVPVLSFGNFQEFAKRLSLDDWFHTRNPDRYRDEFERLAEPQSYLAEADRQLSLRLSGGIDTATAYMANSAYRATTSEVPDVKGAVVIFLHDFYDSPHVYRYLIFPDFWKWICFTLDTLNEAGIRYFVKPHPNQVAFSGTVLDELNQRYPGLPLISSSVTNRQLVDGGMVCAVTVHGTVAHEMAYFGIPTIACAHHPHIAFDFCKTAHDRDTYAAYLRDSATLDANPELFRAQALQFYVMHNLSLPPDAIVLRDAAINCWCVCLDSQQPAEAIRTSFESLRETRGFQAFLDDTRRLIRGAHEHPNMTACGFEEPLI